NKQTNKQNKQAPLPSRPQKVRVQRLARAWVDVVRAKLICRTVVLDPSRAVVRLAQIAIGFVHPRKLRVVEVDCPAQHNTAPHSPALHSTAPHSTAPHRTAQHSTAQTQHNTASTRKRTIKMSLGSVNSEKPISVLRKSKFAAIK